MEDKLKLAQDILKKYNQEHLLNFYNEISEEQKNILINQILTINFEEIITLYTNSINHKPIYNEEITPLLHFEKDKLDNITIEKYTNLGETIIKNNQ